jgi:outer membrane protein OmpA-like peptidoglycan-associated protein
VGKGFFTVLNTLFRNKYRLLALSIFCSIILSGCASSNVTREVSSNIDQGVENARALANDASTGNLADSYGNSNQATKGIVLGGAAGGIAGAFTSAVGVIPGAVMGAIMGGSYGTYIDRNTTLEDQLQNRGATVVVLGDHILIMVPSARIFYTTSARIKPSAYSTLNLLVRYINSFTKMMVKVSVYTSACGSEDFNLALSQDQAGSVSKYFLEAGIDARLLYAVGYGGSHLVQKNDADWDGSDNYRIEITLEKQYV